MIVGMAQSNEPPQTPQVKAEQKAERPAKTKQDTADKKESSENSFVCAPTITCNTTEQKTESKGEHGREEGTEFWPSFRGYRLKITDTLLAAFTFLLFIATVFLYCATRALVKGVEDTAQRQLRAYVSEQVDIANLQTLNRGYLAPIEIKNTGLTPAYDLHCWAMLAWLDDPESRAYLFEAPARTIGDPRFVVNPGSSHSLCAEIELNGQEMNATHKRLYIWGEIKYLDAFKKPHTKKFRLYQLVRSGTAIWAYCDQGNDAD